MDDAKPSRLPLWMAVILSLLWIGFMLWLHRTAVFGSARPDPLLLGTLVGPLLIPVATFFAIAAACMAGSRRAGAWPAVPAEDLLDHQESQFTGTAARINTLRTLLSDDLEAVTSCSARLQAEAATLTSLGAGFRTEADAVLAAGESLSARLPALQSQAESVNAALTIAADHAAERLTALEMLAQRLEQGFAAADLRGQQAVASLSAALSQFSGIVDSITEQADAASNSIEQAAKSSFESSAEALTAMRSTVDAQSAALAASISDARAALAQIGGDAARTISQRLAGLRADADAIEAQLANQIQTTENLAASAERSFRVLDSRLAHSAATSTETFNQLTARVAEVNAATDSIAIPLKEGRTATTALEAAVASLKEVVLQTVDVLGATLPARTVEASRAAETMTGELNALVTAIDGAHGRAADLAIPINESRATIDAATLHLEEQRRAIETAGQALVVELEQARQLISEVENQTRDTSLAAATRLTDAMTRVRDVANQTAGTMRETLDGVIGEARTSLAAAADTAMRQSFVTPITEQAHAAQAAASAASEAAGAAAERTAASMLALANALKAIEERTSRAGESLEALVQRDLNASAQLLTDRMAGSAAAILSALGKPMSDAELESWRKGERSLFTGRAAALLNRSEKRELRALLDRDDDFAAIARRHIADFEALTSRIGDGPLATALRQSDSGRITMALTEAMEG